MTEPPPAWDSRVAAWLKRNLFPNFYSVGVFAAALVAIAAPIWPKHWWFYRGRFILIAVAGVCLWILSRLEQARARQAAEVETRAAAGSAAELLRATTNGFRPIIQGMQDLAGRGSRRKFRANGEIGAFALRAASGIVQGAAVRATIFLHRGGGEFVAYQHIGRTEGPQTKLKFTDASDDFGRLLTIGEPQVCPDVSKHPNLRERVPSPSYRSFVSAAIRTREGHVFGIVSVDHPEVDGVSRTDGDVLTVVADMLATAWTIGDPPDDTQPWKPESGEVSQ